MIRLSLRWRLAVAAVAACLVGTGCSLTGGNEEPNVIAYFTDVGDLVPGAQVQINDVKVGRVIDIGLVLKDGKMQARVEMHVTKTSDIRSDDLEAAIRQTSLLGEQFVQLIPTTTEGPIVSDELVTISAENTDRRVDIETFLGDLSSFIGGGGLEDLNRFTHAQALILEDRGHRFGEVLEELETFTAVLADRRFDIGAAIDSLGSAASTLATNRATLDSFLDSLDEANVLLAEQGNQLGRLFRGMRRFATVNTRFIARHENAIKRQFKALRPIFSGLAGAEGDLRVDITQLREFFELFPTSLGTGPGLDGGGDYVQAEAVLCEAIINCHSKGEKGDVPGEGS